MTTTTAPAERLATRLNKAAIQKPLLVCWTITILLFRPASLGELAQEYVFFVSAALTGMLLVIGWPQWLYISRRRLVMFLLIQLTFWYFFVQGLILSSATQTVINASVVAIGASTFIFLTLNPRTSPIVLKTFVWFHTILGLSSITTTLLLIPLGFNLTPLVWLRLPVYDGHFIAIPFSEYWSNSGIGTMVIPRFVGIYREPGAAAPYFLVAYFLTYFLDIPRRRLIRLVLLVSIALLFSTAGVLNLIIGSAALLILNIGVWRIVSRFLKGRLNQRLVLVTVVLVVLTAVWLSLPSSVNLREKLRIESGQSRWDSLILGLEAWRERPIFGHGYYDGFDPKTGFSATTGYGFIGLLATGYQIGLVGVALYLAMWAYGMLRMGSLYTLCVYMPSFLSILFFQSDYNGVFVLFLMLMDTRIYGPAKY